MKKSESQPWLDKGQSILSTIDELIDEINAHEHGRQISDKYRSLKEHVRSEAKLCRKREKSELESAERDYCDMITKIAAWMTAPVNCNPFEGKLVSCLAYVRVDVFFFVSSLEDD